MKSSRHTKAYMKEIGTERVKNLFELAEHEFADNPMRSRRYIDLAVRIAMRYNIRITKYKKHFCSKCHTYMIPAKSATIRAHKKYKAMTRKCHKCGNTDKHPYIKEQKERSVKKVKPKTVKKSKAVKNVVKKPKVVRKSLKRKAKPKITKRIVKKTKRAVKKRAAKKHTKKRKTAKKANTRKLTKRKKLKSSRR